MQGSIEPTVFVVDDDPAARDSVCALARSKGVRAEGFESAEQFLASFDASRPGCLVLDYNMPGMNGLELQQNLADRGSTLPIIVITAYANVQLTVQAMEKGAFTLLEKSQGNSELWNKIEQALATSAATFAGKKYRADVIARLETLTKDEEKVLRLLMLGRSNKQIASELEIGLRTVELRRSRIMEKMGARSLPELVRMVIIARGTDWLTESVACPTT